MNSGPRLRCLFACFAASGTLAFSQNAPVIEIEVLNTASSADDYIGWTPVPARIRQVGTSTTPHLNVRLKSTQPAGNVKAGEVVFAAWTSQPPTPASFHKAAQLDLTLAPNAWVSFWVAGKQASMDGQDVNILVSNIITDAALHSHPLMVRVRKDAETLEPLEIKRFLDALAALHNVAGNGANSKYAKYVITHGEASFYLVHYVPGFVPWHRAFLLSLERELQAIDARVALPYWKFDAKAPKLFSKEFLGRVNEETGSFEVEFSETNPIRGWSIAGSGKLQRANNAAETFPIVELPDKTVFKEYWELLEDSYHAGAHNHIKGWLASAASPRDPLFFLLHANVDRAWAEWQRANQHYEVAPADATEADPRRKTYYWSGRYPGPSAEFHAGSYLEDSLWPWNGKGGDQNTNDPGDDWPTQPASFPFPQPMVPASAVTFGPSPIPLNKELIDDVNATGKSKWIGASYDSVLFSP